MDQRDDPTPTEGSSPMWAIQRDRYGDADVLIHRQVERPRAEAGEVLLAVGAAGLDRGAWHLMTGRPLLMRPMFGLRRPRQPGLGLDVAGTVVALGADVDRFSVGDRVLGVGMATFAEFARASVDKLVATPDPVPDDQAGALSISGLTALQALRQQAEVQPGQHVLVVGASGGVGSFAVQIAKHDGAEVTGVCRGSKADAVRALGADHVIDYTVEDSLPADRYDVIIDIGGNRSVGSLRRSLTERGTLVIVGGEGGDRLTGGLHRQLQVLVSDRFVGHRLRTFVSPERREDIAVLAGLLAEGAIRTHVDSTVALDGVPAAMRRLVAGEVTGKVVVVP